MRKNLMWLAALAPLALGQTTTVSYSYNGLPLRIFQDSADTWTYIRIFVPRALVISSVTAGVQVQYSGVGDLNVYMFSPQATRTKLLERNCGSLVNIDTTFDDSAPNKFADFCPSEAGRGPFRGNEPLGNFNGQNSYGYWTIGVENNGSDSQTGFINSFTVTVTGTPTGDATIGQNTVISATSYKGGAVSPGEMLGLFGVNLGPTTAVTAPSGANLPLTLGGSSVKIGNIPAPLYYVSDKLILVQAPTGLVPGNDTTVQVTSAAGPSKSISLPIVPARPGIFTYESGPTGQARAVNQDGTLNGDGTNTGTDVAAAAGSIIQVFATGLGPVDPPIADGTLAPQKPLSVATLPITATIGGQSANVTYAGAAPGLVGIYQVNVRIPANTRQGPVSLVLSAGGNVSQDGVRIQVK
jgi:uncharacterized protein (TIGR03437 family)